MLYNFPFKVNVMGKTLFPTVAKLPEWAANPAYRNAAVMTGAPTIKLAGPYREDGLGEPLEFHDAPKTTDWDKLVEYAKSVGPIDEPDIVEWMHTATAANVVISRVMEEYKRAGSSIVGTSNDAYIPGVKVEDIKFNPELGRTVASRGRATVVTPRGNFNVPVPGKATGVFKDILSFGAVLESFLKQWTAALLKFRELATNPQSRISFPSFRGLSGPLFFTHSASLPTPVNLAEFSISTNKPQAVIIRGRNVDDYRDVLFEDKIELAQGQNVILFPFFGFPAVPPMVIELQPADQTSTILDYWSAYP